jgi:hypothetical protein
MLLQLLYFSREDGTTVVCTVGLHDITYRTGDRCEVISKIKGTCYSASQPM